MRQLRGLALSSSDNAFHFSPKLTGIKFTCYASGIKLYLLTLVEDPDGQRKNGTCLPFHLLANGLVVKL